jgi:hypothetical protein
VQRSLSSSHRLGAAKPTKRSGAGDLFSLTGCGAVLRPGRLPELSDNLDWVDPSRFQPQRMLRTRCSSAVVQAAERNGEFVAYLTPKGGLLGEAHLLQLEGLAPANEAGSGSDVLGVIVVAVAADFPSRRARSRRSVPNLSRLPGWSLARGRVH